MSEAQLIAFGLLLYAAGHIGNLFHGGDPSRLAVSGFLALASLAGMLAIAVQIQ